jgi:putative toxin-antitoxin system antitoxin component (TIGR02293 family)
MAHILRHMPKALPRNEDNLIGQPPFQEGQMFSVTASLLGGTQIVFGRDMPTTRMEVHEALVRGLSAKALIYFIEHSSIERDVMVSAAGTSVRTFLRLSQRKKARLDPELSSRTWKFAEILAKAMLVFGDKQSAEKWLIRPALGLDGQRPIDLLETETGRELVDEYLDRMEYGAYS